MTDQTGQPGPGWWQASDGNWYPPHTHPSAPPPPPPPPATAGGPIQYGMAPPAPSNGLATAALVLGIVSIFLFWSFGFGVFFGALALVFGFLGRKKAATLPGEHGRGLATAGIITGLIGTITGVIFFVLALVAVESVVDQVDRIGDEYNSDPSDGVCDDSRAWQDPDC